MSDEQRERKQRGTKLDVLDERIRARNIRSILRAAAGAISEKGYEGVSMLEIARKSGLPRSNVYYYFPSKEDIYRALLRELIHGWEMALRHIAADREPADGLRSYINSKLDYCRRNPIQSRLFASEIMGGAKFLTRRDRDYMHALTKERLVVLETWMDEGKIARVNPRHLLMMIWGATQFLSTSEPIACDTLDVSRLKPSDFDRAAETIVEIVLKGTAP